MKKFQDLEQVIAIDKLFADLFASGHVRYLTSPYIRPSVRDRPQVNKSSARIQLIEGCNGTGFDAYFEEGRYH